VKQEKFFSQSINRGLLSHHRTIFIDSDSIFQSPSECMQLTEAVFANTNESLLQLNAEQFVQQFLHLISALGGDELEFIDEPKNDLLQLFSSLRQATMVIYQANLLDKQSLDLLSALHAFIKRNRVDISLIFVATKEFKTTLQTVKIDVDRYYTYQAKLSSTVQQNAVISTDNPVIGMNWFEKLSKLWRGFSPTTIEK